MDSLTQIVLGAGVGEALLGKKVGNRAILWGGIIATIPDLDVIPTIWMDAVDGISFHRGFSHSLLFCILASPVFGWLLQKIYCQLDVTRRNWTVFSFWVLFTHPILDCFTSWGTQLFWPLDYRVAFNTIFVVDPLYTVPFLLTIIWLMFYHRESKMRQRVNYAGLIVSSAYLALTVVNKQIVNDAFEEALKSQRMDYKRFATKPTPLNNILWFATIETKDGYYLGYYSFFDRDRNISFDYFEKQHQLLSALPESEKLQTLLYITKGYYAIERDENRLLLHDLRFGQATNWKTGKGDFVFTFFLEKKNDGESAELSITQKPRNTDDLTKEMFVMLWQRMLGMKDFKMQPL